ncbi:DUF397 domain-containing protein [Streptomyces sp. NBC_00102]|uniref:DUF397 domain-containing protein n=1 Tax=Streptomyces sp. NBC_00102 TaxID=2975652 RepID=UPI002251ACD0|nr:DUF397 domain-containing protein [Streptomyces sp. NBC_00102]MCX5397807.1 DUF397 domain-containing protein [Streptomyces sp. NBC_00102]
MTEAPDFFKSSYSSNGGDCVEVATNLVAAGVVPVRDSKDLSGPVLGLSTGSFASFLAGVKSGGFETV